MINLSCLQSHILVPHYYKILQTESIPNVAMIKREGRKERMKERWKERSSTLARGMMERTHLGKKNKKENNERISLLGAELKLES